MKCLQCDKESRSNGKYCSVLCQQEYQRNLLINEWLSGKHDGIRKPNGTAEAEQITKKQQDAKKALGLKY